MSTPLFLLASLPIGLVAAGILWLALTLLERMQRPWFGTEATSARLQRRLDRRLARGEDRYFEELRSIQASIETNARTAAIPSRNWLGWPRLLLLAAGALWLGAVILTGASIRFGLGTPPAWTAELGTMVFLLLGLSYIVDPERAGFNNLLAARLGGVAFFAFGCVMLTFGRSAGQP